MPVTTVYVRDDLFQQLCNSASLRDISVRVLEKTSAEKVYINTSTTIDNRVYSLIVLRELSFEI